MLHQLRVLVVDEVASDFERAFQRLEAGGFRCVSRQVASEAKFREALRDFAPHLILSELSLPQFGGLLALQIAAREAPDVPFIFCTTHLGGERAIEMLHYGAADFVVKSNTERLVHAVRRALRRSAEQRRKRIAEQRIRDIIDISEEWIWELNVEGRHVFSNESVERVLGLTPDKVIGTPFSAHIHPEDDRHFRETLATLGENRRSITGVITRWRHVSGDTRWLESNVLALIASDGHVIGYRGIHRDITERKRQEDAVRFLAHFDPLTGLAKRAQFCRRLDAILARPFTIKHPPAVVAFDIDRLSSVNDSLGRDVGDMLLQQVAERLRHHFGGDDRVGYLGGGAFVLVLLQVEREDGITSMLDATVFQESFSIDGHTIRVSCKSGIARYPDDGEDGNTLVQHAEAALKQAKACGEQYLHYRIQMHSETAERLALEHRLRNALDENQFELYYQPQVDISTGRITGVEALLRWNDPEAGIVLPERFLPLLESSGMILPVGDWVLRQAVQDCQRWQRVGFGPLRVAVNVSAQQVRRRNFVQHVLDVVGEWTDGYGIDLEITETGLLPDVEGTSHKLRELRRAGLRVAIDDFGTGYSSLGLLPKLPVDLLKIDRAFISGLPADKASVALVSSIINLAFAFNLVTVAEGVETPRQLEKLRKLKCDQSQGHLHARPLPRDQLEELLLESRPPHCKRGAWRAEPIAS